jgi:hypothetical protein
MGRSKLTTEERKARMQIATWLRTQVRALVTATKDGKPAVAGVQSALKLEFPDRFDTDVKWRTYRQFVGRVICEIMTANKYEKDRKGKIRDGEFSSGMIYRRKSNG